MKVNVKDWQLNDTGEQVELPDFMFNYPVREDIVAHVVKWQLDKKRSGNASTKTRSDVSGTTRKPWGQKESGKARQGSLIGPHFRGGGVVFGPHPRKYGFKLNKKVKVIGLFSVLSDRFRDGNIMILDSFEKGFSKTSEYDKWKKEHGIKSGLFIGDVNNMAFRNIYSLNQLDIEGINVLSIVKHEKIFFDLNSLGELLLVFGGERHFNLVGENDLEGDVLKGDCCV